MDFLDAQYYNNTIQSYLIVVGMILVGMLIIRLFRKGILHRLKKWATTTETNFDDYVVGAVERFILPMLNVGVMYFSIKYLNLTEEASKILRNAFVIAFTFYAIRLTTSSLRILLESYARGQEGGEEKVKQLR
ncbi:MAG TPA: mechanosensitive ion channel family protein, partial [Cyclobacteriaceae bacterium]|nr:mechanosensitive ion channel family protein [Cyclobacteriaceae bacterium]